MTNVVDINKAKDPERAHAVLVPLYRKLAEMELELSALRKKIASTERQLLTPSEAAKRAIMRRANKLDW